MKKQKGSYTLEAVIVMSTIIMLIMAIISAFLLIYQNAVMYYVATQAAQEGAIRWADMGHSMEGEITGNDQQGLYYRIGELFGNNRVDLTAGDYQPGSLSGSDKKRCEIQVWAKQRLKELMPDTLVGSGKETVDVQFHNYVVKRVVEVSITKEVDIPFRDIMQYFDQDLDIHVTARAALSESAEYIRNIDYGVELAQEVWAQIKGAFDGLLNSKK